MSLTNFLEESGEMPLLLHHIEVIWLIAVRLMFIESPANARLMLMITSYVQFLPPFLFWPPNAYCQYNLNFPLTHWFCQLSATLVLATSRYVLTLVRFRNLSILPFSESVPLPISWIAYQLNFYWWSETWEMGMAWVVLLFQKTSFFKGCYCLSCLFSRAACHIGCS